MSHPWDQNTYRCRIDRHVDGDTTHVTVDPGFDLAIAMTIRWSGIDAPELSTPEGKAALAFVRDRLPEGSWCLLETDKDRREKYGRYLGAFYDPDGDNVNLALVNAGLARLYDGGPR